MSAFDFAFTLFSLVLGLALAEVLTGLARALKARSPAPGETVSIRIGWLTPAIGALVMLDVISTWLLAWTSREGIAITFPNLIFGTLVSSVYYVAASLVWPEHPAHWPDIDAWFDRHKGQVGGAIAAANVGFLTIDLVAAPTPVAWMEILYIALAASLIVTRRRWQSGAVLAAMLAVVAAYVAGVLF